MLDYDSTIAARELWEVYAVNVSPKFSKTPSWGSTDASVVPDLSPATIQDIIDRKNRKVDNYVDRDRYAALWLLIVAEDDRHLRSSICRWLHGRTATRRGRFVQLDHSLRRLPQRSRAP